jgi:site-specific DNA-adenine methylase
MKLIELNPPQINVKASIPYQGSKKELGVHIINTIHSIIPDKRDFIDVFGGGGSVSIIAYQSSYFNEIHYNEIRKKIYLLMNYIIENGLTKDFNTFISHSEHESKIKEDSYYSGFLTSCYGFGSSEHYFCNNDDEIIKHMIHNALFFDDYSLFPTNTFELKEAMQEKAKEFPIKYNTAGFVENFTERRLNIWYKQKNILRKNPTKYWNYGRWYTGDKGPSGKYLVFKGGSDSIENKKLHEMQQLQHLENMEQLRQIEIVAPKLTITNRSFEDLVISKDSIVYLDPPYKNTANQYGFFDYDLFVQWAKCLKVPAFLSEYSNTLDWKEVFSKDKFSKFSPNQLKGRRIEYLFWNGIST